MTSLWTFKEGSSSAGPLDLPRRLYLPDPKTPPQEAPFEILARSAREKEKPAGHPRNELGQPDTRQPVGIQRTGACADVSVGLAEI